MEPLASAAASGSVVADDYSGGLVGRNYGTVEDCISEVSINGGSRVGGLVGYSTSDGAILRSCAKGIVSASDRAGGLVGSNVGSITDCYSTASVEGTSKVGGLAGETSVGTVTNCYSAATVTALLYYGVFYGDKVSGTTTGCFYDSTLNYSGSSPLVSVGRGSTAGMTAKTTVEMYDETLYTDAGWDFTDVWWISPSSYPMLAAEQKTKVISLGGSLGFGGVDVGSSSQLILTISNSGNSDLTVTSISYPSGFSGSWSGVVAPGGSQNVTVTFAPTQAQSYSGTITVNSDMTDGTNTASCSGIGIGGIISLGGSLSFGDVIVNASSQKAFTIYNNGTGNLVVSSITYPSGFSGSWSGTIAAGGSQVVTATFSPTAVQSYSGSLIVNSDAVSGIATLPCSGVGIAQTRIIGLSGSMSFGNVTVGSSSQSTLTIQNTGNSSLTVSSIAYPAGFSGAWSGTIAAGASQNVTVTFAPTEAKSYSGNIIVNTNATAGTNVTAASGTGSGSVIRLSSSVNFGSVVVGDSVQRTLAIYNDGNESLSVYGITYPDAAYSGSWSGSIGAGSSRNVTVTFTPASNGDYSGTITVASDANIGTNQTSVVASADAETKIVNLSGNMSFGDVVIGNSPQRTLTIQNTGNRPLQVYGISYTDPAFSGAWSGTIAAGSSQNVTVTFTPSAAASYSETILVASDATSGTGNISCTGNGIAQTRIISISGSFIFDDTVVGETNQTTMTISNSGNTALAVSSISYPAGFSGAWSGTIAAGGSQDVTINFEPDAQGNFGGVMAVNSDSTSGTNSTVLWGVGIERVIRLTGDMDLGAVDVGEQANTVLTIHNDGNRELSVTGILYPEGFSGSWSGTIAAGGSQNVTVTFVPVTEQNYDGTIIVGSDKTSGNNMIACSGIGSGGVIRLFGLLDFGDIVAGQSDTKTLLISNDGTGPMEVTSISYPDGFSGDWSGTIAAGGSQSVTITFAPTSAKDYSGNVTVNSDATSGTDTIAISGVGVERVIALSGELGFGNVDINTTSDKTLTITNNGNRDLTVSSISYPAGFSGSWSGPIAAGGSQNVTVTFSPVATGDYSGNISVTSDATSGDGSIAVSGKGVTRVIALSGNMDFGDVSVGESADLTLTITNNGNMDLTVNDITYPDDFSGSWSGTISAGQSQDVTVNFAPTEAAEYSDTITVNCDSTSGDNSVACGGVGIGGIVRLSGNIDFGSIAVNSSDTATLTIYNDGTGDLEVSSISYSDNAKNKAVIPTADGVFSGTWSGTIAAGGSQDVIVTFLPTNEQNYSGTITVNSDKVSGTNTVSVSGVGAGGVVRLDGDLDFGDVVINQDSDKQLTIYNDGTSSMTVSDISYPAGFSGDWSGGSIAAGASKAVTVTFAPAAAQSYGGSITVTSDATSGDGATSCAGEGINRVISLVLADPDMGDVDIDTADQTTLTITNNGNRSLEITSISYPTGFSGSWSGGSIAAGASKAVTVTFAPTQAASYSGTITVASDKTEGENTISIAGFGVNRVIAVSGDMDFGYVKNGESDTSTLTIYNSGNRALGIASITYPAGFSGDWSGAIAAGGSQDVTVTFAPTEGQSYSGNIVVNSDSTSGTSSVECFGFALPGAGTELDPFVLTEDFHIDAVNEDLAAHYKLGGNINLGDYEYTDAVIAEDTGIYTIDFEGTVFTGSFDGDGYVISNINIDAGSGTLSTYYLGLFGKLGSGAQVLNLNVNDVTIKSGYDTRYVGGLCGYNEGGDIFNCSTDGTVTGKDVNVSLGGLCGYNSGTISVSSSSVDLTSGPSSFDTGGLCGTNDGSISDCYAVGSVSGDSYVGGFYGYNNTNGTIDRCYSVGPVYGVSLAFVGGFGGWSTGDVSDCFFDLTTSGAGVTDNALGAATSYMTNSAMFTSASWDFVGETANGTDDIWVIKYDGNYPVLAFNTAGNPDFNNDGTVDAADLNMLLADWMNEGSAVACDINGDTVVDFEDFAVLAENWLATSSVD